MCEVAPKVIRAVEGVVSEEKMEFKVGDLNGWEQGGFVLEEALVSISDGYRTVRPGRANGDIKLPAIEGCWSGVLLFYEKEVYHSDEGPAFKEGEHDLWEGEGLAFSTGARAEKDGDEDGDRGLGDRGDSDAFLAGSSDFSTEL